MKITIVSGPFHPTPPAPTGAVQRIWSDLAECFARRGHEVTLLARAFPGQPSEENRAGVRVRRRTSLTQGPNSYRNIVKDSWYSFRMAAMLPRADILVTNAFWAPVFATPFQRWCGRVIVHVATAPKGQLFLYRGVSRLDTVSDAMKDQILKQAPWAAGRVTVSPNPIDLSVFAPPAAGREWSASRDRTLVYTGRIHPTKGCAALVQAWASLRRSIPGGANLKLRLIGAQRPEQGGGGEKYVAELRALAPGLPLRIDEPIFERTALAAALQECDFYCYPSMVKEGESFGVAPLEAMATGLAPVVSDMPAFRQFMQEGVHGLFFDHRAHDPVRTLADRLAALISAPELCARMGRAAAEKAQEYSYDAAADRHIKHFEGVLAERHAVRASRTRSAA